jgi:predicted permease
MFHYILNDLRLGLRRLVKTPAASVTVVTALSVGIGLCALMFSVIDGAILPTLPFDGGERVVHLARSDRSPISTDTYRYWDERQRSFEGLGMAPGRSMNLDFEGRASEPVSTAAITVSTFALLSVQPVIGRAFSAADAAPGAPAVVLVSDRLWRTRFTADPGIVGRVVRLSSTPAEIVGVMPEGFGFPWNQDAWTPLSPEANAEAPAIFGLLRDGVSREAAAAELSALDGQRPRPASEPVPAAIRLTTFTDIFNPPGRAQLLAGVMLTVALLVLLVACANVTNVLLAGAAVRSREVAVRTALGASRARVATQFWIEVSVLALGGALGGSVLTLLGVRLIRNAVSTTEGLPFWWDLRMDPPVLAFISIAAMLAAAAAGVVPVLFSSRWNTQAYLKDSSRSSSSRRLGTIMGRLIAAEMAVSLVLLVAAGLFIRSAVNVQLYEFPFEPAGVYTSVVNPAEGQYESAAAWATFGDRLEESLAAIPQVSSAGMATTLPGLGGATRTVAIEGRHRTSESGLPTTRSIAATPGFFPTFRTAALTGRLFDSRDRPGGLPVAVVNASFERLHLPQGAVGRRIALPERTGEPLWLTIVGVVPDLLAGGLQAESQAAVYVPFAQSAPARFQIAMRSQTSASALAAPVRQAVAGVDRDATLAYMQPLDEAIDGANAAFGWLSALFLVAGGLALALAAIGLYGIMAFWVSQRTREIGLRMAIGGGRNAIVGFVLRRGMRPVMFGLAFGMLAALPVAWALRGGLLEVTPFDPLVFGAVLGVLVSAGGFGCLGPALRATRIDPQAALAAE